MADKTLLKPKMSSRVRAFLSDEIGAVTVDWVVLTAVIVGLALVIIGIVIVGLQEASSGISADVVSAATRN